jgi:hypothetical protein
MLRQVGSGEKFTPQRAMALCDAMASGARPCVGFVVVEVDEVPLRADAECAPPRPPAAATPPLPLPGPQPADPSGASLRRAEGPPERLSPRGRYRVEFRALAAEVKTLEEAAAASPPSAAARSVAFVQRVAAVEPPADKAAPSPPADNDGPEGHTEESWAAWAQRETQKSRDAEREATTHREKATADDVRRPPPCWSARGVLVSAFSHVAGAAGAAAAE